MYNKPNTIYVDDWSSRCGSCGKDCDYKELQHDSLLGYAAMRIADTQGLAYPLEGCHAEFKYITHIGRGLFGDPDYDKNVCYRLRPDLEYV